MTEHDDFRVVEAAMRRLTGDIPQVRPIGPAATRRFVRRRRQIRTVMAGLVVLALVAVPVAAFAALRGDSKVPPGPADSVAPSPVPSGTFSPAPSQPPARDGRFTREQLLHAAIDIPAWGPGASDLCPTGPFQMRGERTPSIRDRSTVVNIFDVVTMDVDGLPGEETVALLWCGFQGGIDQAVAFTRDDGGSVRTIGQIVSSSDGQPIKSIGDIRAGADRTVEVHVGDAYVCCGADHRTIEKQWRGYTYDGTRFRQTSGPTAFHPARPGLDLVVSSPAFSLGAPANGRRSGTLDVTVRNNGTKAAEGVWLEVVLYGDGDLSGRISLDTAAPGCTAEPRRNSEGRISGHRMICHLPSLPAGSSRTVRVSITVTGSASLGTAAVAYEAFEEQPAIRMLSDPRPDDNHGSHPVN